MLNNLETSSLNNKIQFLNSGDSLLYCQFFPFGVFISWFWAPPSYTKRFFARLGGHLRLVYRPIHFVISATSHGNRQMEWIKLHKSYSEQIEFTTDYSNTYILIQSSIYRIAFSKVFPIIKCTCTVFIDNFRNISTNSSL